MNSQQTSKMCWAAVFSRTYTRLLLGFVLLLSTLSPLSAEEISGEVIAANCIGCHGERADDKGIPPIQGLPVEYFALAMQAFRKRERPTTIMDRIAENFSDKELRAVAEYFAKQDQR